MTILKYLPFLFKAHTPLIETEKATKSGEEEPGRRFVYVCKFCKTKITAPRFERLVRGKQLHLCANPHGLLFEVVCFSQGWNYIRIGSPTEEFTWFPGYRWQIILCSHCLNHLGWEYSCGNETFLGLIRGHIQLISREEK